jgi:hypothetical protein
LSYITAIIASLVVALIVTRRCRCCCRARLPTGPDAPLVAETAIPDTAGAYWTAATAGYLAAAGAALCVYPFLRAAARFSRIRFPDALARAAGPRWKLNQVTIRASKELRAVPGVRNFGRCRYAEVADEVGRRFHRAVDQCRSQGGLR